MEYIQFLFGEGKTPCENIDAFTQRFNALVKAVATEVCRHKAAKRRAEVIKHVGLLALVPDNYCFVSLNSVSSLYSVFFSHAWVLVYQSGSALLGL